MAATTAVVSPTAVAVFRARDLVKIFLRVG
jgi:hypothetical protein